MSRSFAFYRLPNDNKYVCMRQEDGEPEKLSSYTDLGGKTGFVFAPFKISAEHPLLLLRPDSVETFDIDITPDFTGILFKERNIVKERAVYSTDFTKFHSNLVNGNFLKIVLSRSYSEEADEIISPELLFKRACSLYPHTFVALVSTPESGTWLTATPEILIENDNGKWHTMALAGTKKTDDAVYSFGDSHEMSAGNIEGWDYKNIKEQQYVAEYIRNCLSTYTDDIDEIGPNTIQAGGVEHLVSNFRFTLKTDNAMGKLISELHPTPAVCGIPKAETYDFIAINESLERKYYSGFAGPLNHYKSTHLYVTLRCMQINENKCRLYAGGGLLKDSEEQTEWMETEAKMETMRKCLAIKRI